jgi:hypothetical protein
MGPDRHPHHSPPLSKPGFPSPPLDGVGTIHPSLLHRSARPPPSHSSSATSVESSQGWPPTPLEQPQASSARVVRPTLVSSQSFPPVLGLSSSASSSTTTIRPRAGKERSASFVGHPQSHKAKTKQPVTSSTAPVTRKKRAPEPVPSTATGPSKVQPRRDGPNRTQYSSCGACRLRRVK